VIQPQMALCVVIDLLTPVLAAVVSDKIKPLAGLFYFHAFLVNSAISPNMCPESGGHPSEYPEFE
jgi:hypothetical protein